MSELRKLKTVRAQVKGQVTRIHTFLTSGQEITYEQAQARVAKLQDLWHAFDKNQSELEVLKITTDEMIEQVTEEERAEREVFELAYCRALDQAHHIMASARPMGQRVEERNVATADTGEYGQWMFFKDAFDASIHNYRKLTEVQKFQYLRSSLKDEALQIISGLNTSAENYTAARELLIRRYENKRLIINSHLAKLMEFPAITKDKRVSLRQFVMHLRTHLKALEILGQPANQWDTIIIFLAKSKLDYYTQREWETEIGQQAPDHMPTIEEFLKFLDEKCCTFEMLNNNKEKQEVVLKSNTSKKEKRFSLTATNARMCIICKEHHQLFNCAEFLKLSTQERQEEVKKKQLCLNCLKGGHYAKECRSSTCRKCSKPHNTLLHRESAKDEESTNKENDLQSESLEVIDKSVAMHSVKAKSQSLSGQELALASSNDSYARATTAHVALSTALVYIRDKNGNQQTCRALLDSGSQAHFITKRLMQKLQLPGNKVTEAVNGIMQCKVDVEFTARICIESRHSGFKAELDCSVVQEITDPIPQVTLDRRFLSVPTGKSLADLFFNKPGQIDLLIGADLFWNILCVGQIKKARGHPTWQKTQFGWILGGEIVGTRQGHNASTLSVTSQSLHEQVERFWTQEEVQEPRQLTAPEECCEKQFMSTVSRDMNGRFIVCLPKDSKVRIGESRGYALQRFRALERRFKRQPSMREAYVKFMEEYEREEHMKQVDPSIINGNELTCFLPHQPIIRPDHITTKLRVVFDASAKTDIGTSLNDMLLPGPNLQKDLQHILLRFRMHKYVITADIAAMYRQIKVSEEDSRLQLIYWRKSEDASIGIYVLYAYTYHMSR